MTAAAASLEELLRELQPHTTVHVLLGSAERELDGRTGASPRKFSATLRRCIEYRRFFNVAPASEKRRSASNGRRKGLKQGPRPRRFHSVHSVSCSAQKCRTPMTRRDDCVPGLPCDDDQLVNEDHHSRRPRNERRFLPCDGVKGHDAFIFGKTARARTRRWVDGSCAFLPV